MNRDVAMALHVLTTTVVCAWTLAGLVLAARPDRDSPATRLIFHELRPLYLPAVVASYVLSSIATGDPFDPWRTVAAGLGIANWFSLKDRGGDDDRWKRRRQRAAEVVSRSGNRLVVAPASAGAS